MFAIKHDVTLASPCGVDRCSHSCVIIVVAREADRASRMAEVSCVRMVVAMGLAMENDSSPEEWQYVSSSHVPMCWVRFVRGLMTIQKLRSFWAHLGQYLKEIKERGRAVGQ